MKVAKTFAVLGILAMALSTAIAADQSFSAPIQGKVGYSFMSDYMWRGVNMSNVLGGHEGTGAQEATYGAGINFNDLSPDLPGTFWVTVQQAYFNDFEGTDGNLAKNDVFLSYMLTDLLGGDWTFGYRYYEWRHVNMINGIPITGDNTTHTQEASIQYALNDGELFKSLTGQDWGKRVLNPTVTYIYDYEMADGGLLMGSLSHDFDLAEITPDLTGLSLTPSWSIVFDDEYYAPYFSSLSGGAIRDEGDRKVAYMQYGLNLGADLSKMMSWKAYKLVANVGVGYVNAYEHVAKNILTDQLFSYFNISLKW
jgi:hypothetical protein